MTPVSGLSLSLGPVDRLSGGEYTCTASNGVGRPGAATVRVIVEGESSIFILEFKFKGKYIMTRNIPRYPKINAIRQ